MPIVQSRTIPATFTERLLAKVRGLIFHPFGQGERVRRFRGVGRDTANLASQIQQPRRYQPNLNGHRIGGPLADGHGQANDFSHATTVSQTR